MFACRTMGQSGNSEHRSASVTVATMIDQYKASRFYRHVADAESTLIPIGVSDATLGFYSPTSIAKNVTLRLRFNDGLLEILQGHRPVSDLDQLVSDWQTNGGEQMRKEFRDAMSAAQA